MLDYILIKTGLNAMLARRDEEGASAVEYGLLVAGIAALIVAIVFLFGGMIRASSPTPAAPSGRRAAACHRHDCT